MLKPLSRALADGNSIYAVIRGTAINNDGRTNGLMAPSPQAQQAVLRAAYDRSGIAPAQVQYVEAHGSGTFLGDPIEAGALGSVLSTGRSAEQPCAIGSVKANIGHLEAAAGIAGLIKVALALEHREIPASLHFKQPNPHIPFDDLKLRVQDQLAPWPAGNGNAYAGVSSFGFGGTNAHVVLQARPSVPSNQDDTTAQVADRAYLLPLSAHSPEALRGLARAYIEFIDTTTLTTATVADLCYSTSLSRTHHEHRLSLVARTTEELVEQLTAFLDGERRAGMHTGSSQSGRSRKLVFVFPGQGSQWRGMGQQLWNHEPIFRASIERTARALSRHVKWSLIEFFATEDLEHPQFDEIDFIQPMLFALQVALAELWRSWNIEPDAVVGQSMGEVAAAHVAGALSLEDAVCIISERSLLLKEKRGLGQMMSVDQSLQDAQRLLEGYEDRVSVAVSSSPTSTVLSGESAALNELRERLQANDIFCAMVKVDVASHSSQMDSLREPLLQVLVNLSPNVPAITLYSTVLGGRAGDSLLDALYWWRNLREPVLFSTTIQNLLADEHDLFLEISGHPVVSAGIQQVLQDAGRKGDAFPSLRREEAERSVLLSSVGGLYCSGYDVDFNALYTSKRRFIKLPSYPWQRERCWLETESSENLFARASFLPVRSSLSRHPLLGTKPITADPAGNYSWEIELDEESLSYLLDHQVRGLTIFPASAYIEMAVAAAGQLFGNEFVGLTNVEFQEALLIAPGEARRVRFVLLRQVGEASAFQVYSQTQTKLGNESWTLHAAGQIQRGNNSDVKAVPEQLLPEELIQRCAEEVAGSDFYLRLKKRGYEYGPSFQAIKRIWRRDGEALGQLQPPTGVNDEDGYKLHPAILDACLQLSAAALPTESSKFSKDAPYLPVSIEHVRFSDHAGTAYWGHVRLRSDDENQKDYYEADVRVLDHDGRVIAEVLGLRLCKYVHETAASSSDNPRDWFYQVQWLPKPHAVQIPSQRLVKGSWLIFADSIGIGQSLSAQLESQGATCVIVTRGSTFEAVGANSFRVDPYSPDDFQQLLDAYIKIQTSACSGVVHLWGLDVAPARATTVDTLEEAQVWTCGSVLSLVQAMAQTNLPNARLWLVTRGVQGIDSANAPISIAASPLWGLGRSISQEHPELRCTNVDIGNGGVSAEAGSLFEELVKPDDEMQIVLRGNKRFCARLGRLAEVTTVKLVKRNPITRRFDEAKDESFRLEITEPGTFENLELRATPRVAPAAGEVQIEIYAAGLNFVDVLKTLGMAPVFADGPMLPGGECAGRITAIGKDVVGHQVGDEVIAIAPACFGKYTTTAAALVLRKPADLTFEEAATIPVAFATAYYALHRLGRLRAGERVLIHAASGGVGLAAVQLAQLAGAEIYATAGSEEKREFLRSLKIRHVMDSRTTAFAEEVLELTKGEGVDLILNSLSGEAIPKGISILRPHGRFLEIGKHDIHQNSHLELAPFKNNLSFFAIDIEQMSRERPELVGSVMCEVLDHFERQELRPLPHRMFPIGEAESGFRLMGQAKQIGKIVISLRDPGVSLVDASGVSSRFKADCTYLIAGGLGGLGLAVAQWMVRLGARHLVLLGRQDPAPPAQKIIVELQNTGAQVEVIQTDITQTQQVAAVVARIRESMPPLKGVVHAAGVLDDGILLQMSHESLWSVMAPKIYGAWNLHTCTLGNQLDFFLLFSSAASIFGPAGQGNYAAGNAFLDALAHHRRALRLPCLSINWGPWDEIGLAAAKGRGSYLERQGFGFISPQRGLDALDLALELDTVAQAVIAPINWRQFISNGQFTPFIGQLVDEEATANRQRARSVGPELGILTTAALLSVDPDERPIMLQNYLREQVARVLGISASRLDAGRPLNKMGLDSVMAVELKYRLERLGVGIPVVKFLKDASIDSLARLVSDGLTKLETLPSTETPQIAPSPYQTIKPIQGLPTPPDSPQFLAAIEQLSENDLDSLLNTLLAEQASL
ncbi:MAG TPA: type I polyketide synthase [Terracidiphilus sp.]|nr:type I polyketide synthase [Terracidiphilus sp.]